MANVDTQPEVIPEPVHLRRDTGPESHSDIPVSPEVHNNGQDLNQDSFASQSTTIAGPILPTTRTKTQGDSDDPFGAPASTSRSRWEMATLKEYFYEELDLDAAAIPLSAYCFMTVSNHLSSSFCSLNSRAFLLGITRALCVSHSQPQQKPSIELTIPSVLRQTQYPSLPATSGALSRQVSLLASHPPLPKLDVCAHIASGRSLSL